MVKNPPANAGGIIRDVGLIPGLRRSLGGKHGNPFQYSYLENSIDRGAWQAAVHRGHKESDTSEPLSLSPSSTGLCYGSLGGLGLWPAHCNMFTDGPCEALRVGERKPSLLAHAMLQGQCSPGHTERCREVSLPQFPLVLASRVGC